MARRQTASATATGVLSTYFDALSSDAPLPKETEAALVRRYREDGDGAAAARLIRCNLRFVVMMAQKYAAYGFPMEDLIQEGNVGLLRALERFDPDRGLRLVTYGSWWIRAHIHEYIIKNWSVVKIGTTQPQRRVFQRLMAGGDEPGRDEAVAEDVASTYGASSDEMAETVRRIRERDLSLARPAADEDASSDRHGLLADNVDVAGDVAETLDRRRVRSKLWHAIAGLEERDREVLLARYSEEPDTLGDIAERWGVSRERVRQIEVRAIRRLRTALNSGAQVAA